MGVVDWITKIDMLAHPVPTSISGTQVKKINKKRIVSSYPIRHRTNDFRDYMSSYLLYLPYASTISLNASDIIDNNLTIDCYLDVRSGQLKYTVSINSGKTIIAMVNGQIRVDMPVTRVDKDTNTGSQVLSSATGSIASTGVGLAVGGGVGAVVGAVGGVLGGTGALASDLMKPNPVSIQGGFNGGVNVDDALGVYLIEYIPSIEIDGTIRGKYGKPCKKVDRLGNNPGYVEVNEVDISGLATEEEKQDIKNRLMQGVYI